MKYSPPCNVRDVAQMYRYTIVAVRHPHAMYPKDLGVRLLYGAYRPGE